MTLRTPVLGECFRDGFEQRQAEQIRRIYKRINQLQDELATTGEANSFAASKLSSHRKSGSTTWREIPPVHAQAEV